MILSTLTTVELACSESLKTKPKKQQGCLTSRLVSTSWQPSGPSGDSTHVVGCSVFSKLSHNGIKAQQFNGPFSAIYFHCIWRSSPPCRGRAVRQEHCSSGSQRFSPEPSRYCFSPPSDPPFSSRPHILGKQGSQVNKSSIELNDWSLYM